MKRRFKDSWEITQEICNGVTWKNAIIMIPCLLFHIPLVWFLMLFEDYEEIDLAKETVFKKLKSE